MLFGPLNNPAVAVCHREDQPVTPKAKWNGEDLSEGFLSPLFHLWDINWTPLVQRRGCAAWKPDMFGSIISRGVFTSFTSVTTLFFCGPAVCVFVGRL